MKFTVKTELKTYTFTENDMILFNGARYFLITQSPRQGYGFIENIVLGMTVQDSVTRQC